MKFGTVTIPATGEVVVASGHLGMTHATLEAHPSNSGILYVKRTGDSGNGYPLAAGASLNMDLEDLANFSASGVVGARLAFAYSE